MTLGQDGVATPMMADATEAAERRRCELAFLGEAGALLAGLLDYTDALPAVARLAVPSFGDWCLIYVFQDDGSVCRLSAAHARDDLGLHGFTEMLEARSFPVPNQHSRAVTAAILDRFSPQGMEEFPGDPEELEFLGRLENCSRMVAPLPFSTGPGSGSAAGVIVLASELRAYVPEDLELLLALARMCGPAIEKSRLYRESVAARERAEKAGQAKDEFLAILSHELRNPLMPVMGWARIFKVHEGITRDPLLREGAQSLERNAENIARLVGDCLDLARISQGKIHMDREQVDLNKVVLASVEAVREAAWEKNLGLVVELSAGPLWVSGDRTRLQQVVMNLLVNAIKFTESGGRVSARSSRHRSEHGEEAEIEVSDTGCGIEPGYLEEIFEPYRQGAGKTLSSGSGLGLGLTISRQIIDLQGGRIWAVSAGSHRGSSFHFRLPLITAAEEEPYVPPPVPTYSNRSLRILVVEDAKDILMLTKIQLEALGHVVLVATDGQQGFERARSEKPDLIISDIKMPRTDGYSLIRQIRAIPELASVPAIALSGLGMRADVQKASEAGFNACLVKPVETAELLRWIHRLTHRDS